MDNQTNPRCTSLHLEGIRHGPPIPLAARVGNMIFSSAVMGADPTTGTWPDDPAAQVRLAFANVKALVEQGGGTVGDIGHVTVLIDREDIRALVDPEWLKMFPDEDHRPARHIICAGLRRNLTIQVEFVAVLP